MNLFEIKSLYRQLSYQRFAFDPTKSFYLSLSDPSGRNRQYALCWNPGFRPPKGSPRTVGRFPPPLPLAPSLPANFTPTSMPVLSARRDNRSPKNNKRKYPTYSRALFASYPILYSHFQKAFFHFCPFPVLPFPPLAVVPFSTFYFSFFHLASSSPFFSRQCAIGKVRQQSFCEVTSTCILMR